MVVDLVLPTQFLEFPIVKLGTILGNDGTQYNMFVLTKFVVFA